MNVCFPNIGRKTAEKRSDCTEDCDVAHAIDACAGMDEFHAYAKAAHHRTASSFPLPAAYAVTEPAGPHPAGQVVVAPGAVSYPPPSSDPEMVRG